MASLSGFNLTDYVNDATETERLHFIPLALRFLKQKMLYLYAWLFRRVGFGMNFDLAASRPKCDTRFIELRN